MNSSASQTIPLPSPKAVRLRYERLAARREEILESQRKATDRRQALADYLSIADAVEAGLDMLSQKLFGQIVEMIETQLSRALQEILEQPIALKVERGFNRGSATIDFHIERRGHREHVMEGQGGSVANILSVGLRLLALTTLDEKAHRRFLVLDEQDCWLHPALVPRLVKIVHEAGKALGFQVLMISHHDSGAFERFADKIYRVVPTEEGAKVEVVGEIRAGDEGSDAMGMGG
jgi:DNA repair exonuclease SbcCD ATPase subunit